MRTCKVEDCERELTALGLCPMHYKRWKRNGSTERKRKPSAAVVIEAAVASDTDECLLWPLAKHDFGYGKLKWNGRTQNAHRVVCELAHGEPPFPKAMALHASGIGCQPACVNPRHLRWGGQTQNMADTIEDQTAWWLQ